MKFLLFCYCMLTFLSVLCHWLIGVYLIYLFSKQGIYPRYASFYSTYKKNNRSVKYYARYLIYMIPVINCLVAFIEVLNVKKVFGQILDQMKKEGYLEVKHEEHI